MTNYEDELQLLIDKVEGNNNKEWVQLVNDLEINAHPDTLRKSFNVGRYCGYRVAKYYQEKMENEYLADDEIERLSVLKDEIYKERVKMQDARREYNSNLRYEARYENLVEVLKEKIEDLADLPLTTFGDYVSKDIKSKSAILMLGDWHLGALVDTQWNIYNVEIAKERMLQLVDKVEKYSQNYNITDLMIEINGDMIEGLINCSNRIQAEEDVVDQIIIVSDMLSQMINNLKPYFNSIKVATTLGNHGRLMPDKKASIGKENMEMLIPVFLKLRIGEDIPILKSQGLDFMKYEFDGKTICLSHGQNDKISKTIEDFAKVYKIVPDEIHLAHTHSYKDINNSNIMVVVTGSMKGSDEYALTLREVTKPSQNLIIYGEDRGIFELTLD